ncbi:UNVERIFIED_CONTAM: Disease resistance protein [Sesamum angustifolium]|uniref:Disease resistance protein n=1 Tax=Sesamum angustifolium TaxID=2727405 RepID=A0AAW2RIE8_9LAMI
MEVLSSVLGVLLAEPCRALFTFLRAKIKNPFYFNANLRALHKDIEDLMERRDEVNEHLEPAAKVGQTALPQVRQWLRRVERFESEPQVRCFRGELDLSARNRASSCCLHFSRLSNQVAYWLNEARRLRGDAKFLEGVAGPDPFPVRSEYIPAPTIDDQATASRNMAKVMNMLSREDMKRIGIWGMGGVGKTTLVKNINNKLTSPSHDSFSIIIWITVSNKTQETESELKKVQKLIADRLKLTLTEEAWRQGLMTEVTLKVEVLNEEEAWRLFYKSAGEVAILGDVEPLAKAITKECAGLPLAIVVVGASLKGKRMVELWKDALNALCRSEPLIRGRIEDKVYNPIKWSYDVLPNQCIKSCFLFCCLFPEDFKIDVDKLVMYWLAEGLLEGHQDIEEVMHRGMTIIEILQDCSLLEQDNRSAVKIHDVIRDVSVWISSSLEKECKSLVRSGIGLSQIREGELSAESYKRVSFMDNQIRELPNVVAECPTVSTLLLKLNKEMVEIPDQFLAAFTSLKILDLNDCYLIKSLPPCFDQLVELRALVLHYCKHLETLPPLGALAKLQVFACSESNIVTLPQGSSACTVETSNTLVHRMKEFKKFKLSIGFPSSNHFFLARESKKNEILWGIRVWGERMEWLFVNTTSINFHICEGLDIMFDKLVANSDEVGCFDTVQIIYIYSCTDWVGIRNNAKFDMLPNLEDISLFNLTRLSCISDLALPLGLKFSRLRCIYVESCDELKYLISLGTTILSLVKLETIQVYYCTQVEELLKFDQSSYPDSVFPNLKKIKLSNCPMLRLLSEENVACPCLENVYVQNCPF